MIEKWPELTKTVLLIALFGAIFGIAHVLEKLVGIAGVFAISVVVLIAVAAAQDISNRGAKS